uniref:DB domain-containing protein n=1 Tax=Heterorhabditis bacteriophora TaxID=37862 RepID=A0A1I7XST0_HETBA
MLIIVAALLFFSHQAYADGILVAEEEGEQAYTAPINNQLITDVSRMNLTRERLTNPNFIFHTCCESRGLPDACLHHCHFNTYTADKLELMFRKEDACPIKAANEIHYCAAQGIDHRKEAENYRKDRSNNSSTNQGQSSINSQGLSQRNKSLFRILTEYQFDDVC